LSILQKYLKAKYASEIHLLIFLKSFLILVNFYSIQKVTHRPKYFNHHFRLLFFGNKYTNSESVFHIEVKILLCLHFGTFMTNYLIFIATFFR
jgi:hypothetical protein